MRKGLKMFKSFLFVPLLALVLVGCDPIVDPTDTTTPPDTTIEDVSILAGWQDTQDSVYDPVVTDGVLHMNFDKAGADWASAKKSLAAVSADLAEMKTLGFELEMKDYEGSGIMAMILKIEFNDIATNPTREVKFKATASKKAYEWDVSEYDLTDALQMLLFIDPGVGTTSGDAVFTVFSFSATSAVTDPIVVAPVVVTKNVYESGDPFDVNKNFYDGGDFVYDIETAEGVTTINYTKYGPEWANAYMIAEGVEALDYLNAKIKGPAGKTALLKIEGGSGPALEKNITFDGSVQDVTFPFGTKETKTGEQTFRLFAEQGSAAASIGVIEISLLEYSSTALVSVVDPDPIVHNVYESGDPFDVNKNFYDGGEDVYEITTAGGVTTLNYEKEGKEWANAYMIAEGVESFAYVNAKIKGPSGKTAMLKIEGGDALEHVVSFTGDVQDVTLAFGSKATKTGEQKFLVFAEQGVGAAVSGKIEISLLEYSSTALVQVVDHKNYYVGMNPWDKEWHIGKFVDGGDGHYNVDLNIISWADQAPGSWSTVKALLDTSYRAVFTKFAASITAEQEMKILVKVGGAVNIETILEFSAGNLTQVAALDLSAKSDADLRGVNEILFFPLFDGANPGTGGFRIDYAKFHAPKAAAIGEDAAPYIIGPTAYAIELGAGGTEISWESKGEWEAFGLPLDAAVDYSAVTKVEVELKARSISELMVKLNDSQEYKLAVSADDGAVLKVIATVTTPINAAAKPFISLFPDGGSSAAGHLTIVSLKLIV
ncbi:MAG: hypothetical protein GX132_02590 [Erysipelotrichia bacterium]|nr:hypothetical protein [Erysipelotrichia bacterium]